ncbi:hypothetical protein [Sphaerochaeta sp. UBA5849]|uniref:hypothetical protein n=1 Tax=Sphaerochaeta sp. UBA5849 TaxID=1947475 RepID=UPI0031F4E3CA
MRSTPVSLALVFLAVVCCGWFGSCELEAGPDQMESPPLTGDDSQIFPDGAPNPANSMFLMHTQYTTESNATIYFKPLSSLQADSYTIECSTDGVTFQDFLRQGQVLTVTTQDAIGIDVALTESLYFRLRIQGGPYDGNHTNTMYARHAPQGGYLQRWSRNTAMQLTGVSAPLAGHGIEVEVEIRDYVSATDFSLNSVLPDAIGSWTWYRINPLNFDEKTLIEGANASSYTTMQDDIGCLIMVEAQGDDTDFYGLDRIMTVEPVQ